MEGSDQPSVARTPEILPPHPLRAEVETLQKRIGILTRIRTDLVRTEGDFLVAANRLQDSLKPLYGPYATRVHEELAKRILLKEQVHHAPALETNPARLGPLDPRWTSTPAHPNRAEEMASVCTTAGACQRALHEAAVARETARKQAARTLMLKADLPLKDINVAAERTLQAQARQLQELFKKLPSEEPGPALRKAISDQILGMKPDERTQFLRDNPTWHALLEIPTQADLGSGSGGYPSRSRGDRGGGLGR